MPFESSPNLSRRDFVTLVASFLGTIMGLMIGIPGIGYLISPAMKSTKKESAKILLGSINDYPINEPTLFSFTRVQKHGWEKTFQSYGIYILRQPGDKVTALSNVCTHLSCRVNWQAEQQSFICPCHDAHFDMEGKVISGPPPRPLDSYPIEVDDQGNLTLQL